MIFYPQYYWNKDTNKHFKVTKEQIQRPFNGFCISALEYLPPKDTKEQVQEPPPKATQVLGSLGQWAQERLKQVGILSPDVKAVEAAKEAKPHWGKVDYEIEGGCFLLHTLESHPEKGTGLGGLLMYSAADEAVEANCVIMKILSAAQHEREFYFKMGCELDTSAMKEFKEENFTADDWKMLSESCPVTGRPNHVRFKALNLNRWPQEGWFGR